MVCSLHFFVQAVFVFLLVFQFFCFTFSTSFSLSFLPFLCFSFFFSNYLDGCHYLLFLSLCNFFFTFRLFSICFIIINKCQSLKISYFPNYGALIPNPTIIFKFMEPILQCCQFGGLFVENYIFANISKFRNEKK